LKAAKLLERQHIFRGDALEAFRVDVEPPGRLLRNSAVQLLAFPAEQPIQKYLCGVRMGRSSEDADDAVAAANLITFFEWRQMFYG